MNLFKMPAVVAGLYAGLCVTGLSVAGLSVAGLSAAGRSAFAQGNPTTAEARANELQSRYMTAVKVELTSKLDAKSAAVGQPVTAKTLAAVTLADGTVIPAGASLEGRVVAARAHSEERPGSILAVTFDHAELKGGRSITVRSLIRGVTLAGSAFGQASPAGISATERNSDTGFGGGLGGGVGGGGLGSGGVGGPIGGTRGGAGGGVGSAGGGLGGGTIDGGMGGDIGVGGAGGGLGGSGGVGGTGTGVGGAGGRSTTQGRNSRQVALPTESTPPPVLKTAEGGETVNPAPRPTGVPGVMLMTNPASDLSGTLTEFGKNIRLDSGTQMTLGVIAR